MGEIGTKGLFWMFLAAILSFTRRTGFPTSILNMPLKYREKGFAIGRATHILFGLGISLGAV